MHTFGSQLSHLCVWVWVGDAPVDVGERRKRAKEKNSKMPFTRIACDDSIHTADETVSCDRTRLIFNLLLLCLVDTHSVADFPRHLFDLTLVLCHSLPTDGKQQIFWHY